MPFRDGREEGGKRGSEALPPRLDMCRGGGGASMGWRNSRRWRKSVRCEKRREEEWRREKKRSSLS